ncbi:MAG: choice-of-anchor tandem repeat GloVer-containing protein [Bryobacteraceae bacterium]|jgi:uncharacterized repeat protein (TIGR03803 family)
MAKLFGTTGNLGSVGDGSVFSLVPTASSRGDWTETVLDSFQGSNGADPVAGVTIDQDGALYGTTSSGGAWDLGTVFKIAPPDSAGGSWTETILYSFKGSDGSV